MVAIARRLLEALDDAAIAAATGLSREEIVALRQGDPGEGPDLCILEGSGGKD
jgi:hypothetical protein